MGFYLWGPKPSIGQQRRNAEKQLARLRKTGAVLSPVVIEGRAIASSFWGKSWSSNLECYSDFASRLPRGRSYVRHSCVIDLQIAKGLITAQVNGSSLYKIKITIKPLAQKTWASICQDCSSSIDSLVELLQGRLSKAVMDRVCRTDSGLFPAPNEIILSCSCPDGASMCKHVAATLYGVAARLDSQPELLFKLRGVDQLELIAQAGAAPGKAAGKTLAKPKKALADADLASVFGLEMAPGMDEVAKKPGKGVAGRPEARKTSPARKPARADLPPAKTGKLQAKDNAKIRQSKPSSPVGSSKKPSRSPAAPKTHSAISTT